MNIEHENFIGIYDNFFSEEFCDNLISYFEWCRANNKSFDRTELEKYKKDSSCILNPTNLHEINFSYSNIQSFIGEFNDVFWNQCYKDYLQQYSVLSDYDQHTVFTYKVQRTDPSGGYHIWHAEDGSKEFSKRVGVYILYLNDVEDGGETEFLYLSKRVKAKKGRLVIFPPNYPWAHRGNPPLSSSKYILTGWTEYS
jgi:hypothetical protein